MYSNVRRHVENLRERILSSCPWKLPYLHEQRERERKRERGGGGGGCEVVERGASERKPQRQQQP